MINAAKVVLTAGKAEKKFAYRHSGYPGRLKSEAVHPPHARRRPDEVVRRAVRGCFPTPASGRQQLSKLKVYPGPDHPHDAQRPEPLEVPGARRTA